MIYCPCKLFAETSVCSILLQAVCYCAAADYVCCFGTFRTAHCYYGIFGYAAVDYLLLVRVALFLERTIVQKAACCCCGLCCFEVNM